MLRMISFLPGFWLANEEYKGCSDTASGQGEFENGDHP